MHIVARPKKWESLHFVHLGMHHRSVALGFAGDDFGG
jgi:hypothetical protein